MECGLDPNINQARLHLRDWDVPLSVCLSVCLSVVAALPA